MRLVNMKKILLLLSLLMIGTMIMQAETPAGHPIRKVLLFGDSQTGWMGERLTAYGAENGFEVATITWDGSTPQKWAKSGKLASIVAREKPDLVMVQLGMNALLERNPQAAMGPSVAAIQKAIGDIPYVWIGPLEWPGKGKGETLVNWLAKTVNASSEGHFFNSSNLKIPRQSSTNPHPTRDGAALLVDKIVEWLPSTGLNFTSLHKPVKTQMKRGSTFIYKKMNQSL